MRGFIIEVTKQVCNYHNINQEFMMSITLLNDMGPQNIVVRCWEFNINLSLLTQFSSILLPYSKGPQNESCTQNTVKLFDTFTYFYIIILLFQNPMEQMCTN